MEGPNVDSVYKEENPKVILKEKKKQERVKVPKPSSNSWRPRWVVWVILQKRILLFSKELDLYKNSHFSLEKMNLTSESNSTPMHTGHCSCRT